MLFWPGNLPEACTRWQSRRRPRGKAEARPLPYPPCRHAPRKRGIQQPATSRLEPGQHGVLEMTTDLCGYAPRLTKRRLKRRARPLRPFLLGLGLALHRHDPQRRNPVALAAQDTEPETVERETLAALWN